MSANRFEAEQVRVRADTRSRWTACLPTLPMPASPPWHDQGDTSVPAPVAPSLFFAWGRALEQGVHRAWVLVVLAQAAVAVLPHRSLEEAVAAVRSLAERHALYTGEP